mgnify:FL=1
MAKTRALGRAIHCLTLGDDLTLDVVAELVPFVRDATGGGVAEHFRVADSRRIAAAQEARDRAFDAQRREQDALRAAGRRGGTP